MLPAQLKKLSKQIANPLLKLARKSNADTATATAVSLL
jgi:hypothetical protein